MVVQLIGGTVSTTGAGRPKKRKGGDEPVMPVVETAPMGAGRPKRKVKRGGDDEVGAGKPKRRGGASTGGAVTGGVKAPAKPNAWNLKVYNYRLAHPGVSLRDVLVKLGSKNKK